MKGSLVWCADWMYLHKTVTTLFSAFLLFTIYYHSVVSLPVKSHYCLRTELWYLSA